MNAIPQIVRPRLPSLRAVIDNIDGVDIIDRIERENWRYAQMNGDACGDGPLFGFYRDDGCPLVLCRRGRAGADDGDGLLRFLCGQGGCGVARLAARCCGQ